MTQVFVAGKNTKRCQDTRAAVTPGLYCLNELTSQVEHSRHLWEAKYLYQTFPLDTYVNSLYTRLHHYAKRIFHACSGKLSPCIRLGSLSSSLAEQSSAAGHTLFPSSLCSGFAQSRYVAIIMWSEWGRIHSISRTPTHLYTWTTMSNTIWTKDTQVRIRSLPSFVLSHPQPTRLSLHLYLTR